MSSTLGEYVTEIEALFKKCQGLRRQMHQPHVKSERDNHLVNQIQTEYRTYDFLIGEALQIRRDIPLLLFRRAWGYQFFRSPAESVPFEGIEDLYEEAISIDPKCGPAYVMLAYLYYRDSLKRAIQPLLQELMSTLPDTSSKGSKDTVQARPLDKIVDEILHIQNTVVCTDAQNIWKQYEYPNIIFQFAESITIDFTTKEPEFIPLTIEGIRCYYFYERQDYVDPILEMLRIGKPGESQDYVIPNSCKANVWYELGIEASEYGTPEEASYAYHEATQYQASPFVAAHSRCYASSDYSDKNNPLEGLRLLEEVLEICQSNADDHDLEGDLYWLNVDFLVRLLDRSPSLLSTQQPRRTLQLIEGVCNTYVKQVRSLEDAKLRWYGGKIYLSLGNMEEALLYLEPASDYLMYEPEFAQDLAYVYLCQEQFDSCVRTLERVKTKTSIEYMLIDVARRTEKAAKDSDIIKALTPRLERIEQKQDAVYGLVSEFGESLAQEFQKIVIPSQRIADQDQEQFAHDVADRVSTQISEILKGPQPFIEIVRKQCAAHFADLWPRFPRDIQALIVDAEATHILYEQQNMPDRGMLIMAWGRVCEIAFKRAFLEPFLSFLHKEKHKRDIPARTVDKKYGEEFKYTGTWNLEVSKLPFVLIEGVLLQAGQQPKGSMVCEFLDKHKFPAHPWTHEVPYQLYEIRLLRNEAAHQSKEFLKVDSDNIRSIMMARGLLARVGQILK